MKRLAALPIIVLLLTAWPASATPIVNGFDLARFDFDVSTYTVGSLGEFVNSTASGSSNGLTWTITPTSLWSARTVTNGTFSFAALGGHLTDNLHPSLDFTITFSQKVQTLIVALSNDNLADSVNFGLIPSYFTPGITFNGTQAVLNNAAGGLVWFTDVDSLTVSHIDNNGIFIPGNYPDGFDLAFHAIASVPEPDATTLLVVGVGLFAFAVRSLRRQEIA